MFINHHSSPLTIMQKRNFEQFAQKVISRFSLPSTTQPEGSHGAGEEGLMVRSATKRLQDWFPTITEQPASQSRPNHPHQNPEQPMERHPSKASQQNQSQLKPIQIDQNQQANNTNAGIVLDEAKALAMEKETVIQAGDGGKVERKNRGEGQNGDNEMLRLESTPAFGQCQSPDSKSEYKSFSKPLQVLNSFTPLKARQQPIIQNSLSSVRIGSSMRNISGSAEQKVIRNLRSPAPERSNWKKLTLICAVCQQKIVAGNEVAGLACGHRIHRKCITFIKKVRANQCKHCDL